MAVTPHIPLRLCPCVQFCAWVRFCPCVLLAAVLQTCALLAAISQTCTPLAAVLQTCALLAAVSQTCAPLTAFSKTCAPLAVISSTCALRACISHRILLWLMTVSCLLPAHRELPIRARPDSRPGCRCGMQPAPGRGKARGQKEEAHLQDSPWGGRASESPHICCGTLHQHARPWCPSEADVLLPS